MGTKKIMAGSSEEKYKEPENSELPGEDRKQEEMQTGGEENLNHGPLQLEMLIYIM